MLSYLVHVGYVLMLLGFLARDVLLLRSLLVVAQSIVAAYALSLDVVLIAFWNVVFAGINLAWVVLILRDRRAVHVPAELKPLYERHFAAMTPREFLRWWALGARVQRRDARLTWAGQNPDALYFLLSGNVRVSRGGMRVAELSGGFFLAEMSLITGRPANADVDAVGEVEVQQWLVRDLEDLRGREPKMWIKVQSIIGLDLVEKIQRGEAKLPAASSPNHTRGEASQTTTNAAQ